MQSLPAAFAALGEYRQFIVYKLVPKADRPGKMDKLPLDPRTLRVFDKGSNWQADPDAKVDAASAIALAQSMGQQYGVGFLFTPGDPFWFLDVDHCLVDGPAWSATAADLMQRLAGAAVEVSQSGSGLHIIGSGTVPAHSCRNQSHGLEFYTEGRFVALTGDRAIGDARVDLSGPIAGVVAQYFPAGEGSDGTPAEWTEGPDPAWRGPEDDSELLRRAFATESTAATFGARCPMSALWSGDPDTLGRYYPDNHGNRDYDASSADAALASHLAFWTGKDCARIERIMRDSALARDKWDSHRTYLRMTISRAAAACRNVYGSRKADAEAENPPSVAGEEPFEDRTGGPELLSGFQYMAAPQQLDYFAGCVYVQDMHQVFTPRGDFLDQGRFKATYGGYVFSIDAENDKTTKNAWEALVESQAIRWPKAQSTTFRPERPTGEMITEEGRQLVNVYKAIPVPRAKGDPSRFLDHLHRILPDEGDRAILLAYMAACVQHIGHKFQWAPLLQGAPGNGKTLFTRCVAHAVGLMYSHFPKADEVGNKFNAWIRNKLFIGIEDVYFPEHRREIIESLKPLITNEWQPVEPKGVDQINVAVCANFILNSNHRDAIRKTRDDRRFAIFYTAQQSAADIERDGMAGDYFPDLYAWLKGTGPYEGQPSGYAIVAEYLHTFDIPAELNPAGAMHRAPRTSSYDQVLAEGLGGIEQEILEAVAQGLPGFAGGWVSSMALDRLIDGQHKRSAIPLNKRREIMQGLGYDWHPALADGRVNSYVPIDGGKPKLFIHESNPARTLRTPAEVVRAYVAAQQSGGRSEAADVFGT